MKYLFDANVFIEAKNRYYQFSFCPGFWDWMDFVVEDGRAATIDMVKDELLEGKDDLADWIKDRKDAGWFLTVDDEATQKAMGKVSAYVTSADFHPPGKAKFMGKADPWLIAKARVIGATLVTYETFAPEAKRKVPIPNVCREFDVPFVNTFDVLNRTAARFGYQPT